MQYYSFRQQNGNMSPRPDGQLRVEGGVSTYFHHFFVRTFRSSPARSSKIAEDGFPVKCLQRLHRPYLLIASPQTDFQKIQSSLKALFNTVFVFAPGSDLA